MDYLYSVITYSNRDLPTLGSPVGLEYIKPKICPICDKAGTPDIISGVIIDRERNRKSNVFDEITATLTFKCVSCDSIFLAEYSVRVNEIQSVGFQEDFYPADLLRLYPSVPSKFEFSKEIKEISPNFVKIYNQAFYAEQTGLEQISGVGYRKSVEFLVKDFVIYFNSEKKDEITSPTYFLSNCINDYIKNPKITDLSKACSYLGNDHAHYTARHTDKDLQTLKKFIGLLSHYIELEIASIEVSEFVK